LTVAAWTAAAIGCGGNAFEAGAAGSDSGGAIEGASDGASTGDGEPPSDSGAPQDARGSLDSAVAPDSASTFDSSPPMEAAPPTWCTGHTEVFCDDFDDYPSINALLGGTTWPSYVQNKGFFALDTTNAQSPPHALRAVGDAGAQVLVVHALPALTRAPTRMRLEFDLRVNGAGNVGWLSAAGFAAIAFGSTIEDGYAGLAIGSGPVLAAAWSVSSDAGPTDAGAYATASGPSGSFPSAGQWAGRYALEIDFDATTHAGCIQVYQGPTAVLSPCLPVPPQVTAPSTISSALGDEAAGLGNTGTVDLEFDNVTFDVR
jgi:hypothetical protein